MVIEKGNALHVFGGNMKYILYKLVREARIWSSLWMKAWEESRWDHIDSFVRGIFAQLEVNSIGKLFLIDQCYRLMSCFLALLSPFHVTRQSIRILHVSPPLDFLIVKTISLYMLLPKSPCRQSTQKLPFLTSFTNSSLTSVTCKSVTRYLISWISQSKSCRKYLKNLPVSRFRLA